MQIEERKIGEIIPYENNPRFNENAVEAVANSIAEFGFKNPIIVDSDGVIIAGHTRHKARQRLGLETVPVIVADDLSEEQVKAYRLADNKVAELATWDFDTLAEELKQIADIDMSVFGFDMDFEFEDVEAEEDDYEVEPPAEPKTKLGDLYQLGNHRLLCGDSTKEEDYNRLTDGEAMDLCVTDPPYNVDYEGATKDKLKIQNDKMGDARFYNFLFDFYSQMLQNLKAGGSFYIFHADSEGYNFRRALRNAGATIRQTLIWVKNSMVLGRQDYQWKHEPCLYGWKDGARHYFINDRKQTTVKEKDQQDYKTMSKDELIQRLLQIEQETPTSAIYEDRPNKNAEHPTMKPVKLIARLIKNSSRRGDKILDPFGGSGKTVIACEKLGRKRYTIELDPKYCDVIINRWETLTGGKAVLISQKEE